MDGMDVGKRGEPCGIVGDDLLSRLEARLEIAVDNVVSSITRVSLRGRRLQILQIGDPEYSQDHLLHEGELLEAQCKAAAAKCRKTATAAPLPAATSRSIRPRRRSTCRAGIVGPSVT